MTKHYCDICGKEYPHSEYELRVQLLTDGTPAIAERFDLCPVCKARVFGARHLAEDLKKRFQEEQEQ